MRGGPSAVPAAAPIMRRSGKMRRFSGLRQNPAATEKRQTVLSITLLCGRSA
jgi:hypothetical protein